MENGDNNTVTVIRHGGRPAAIGGVNKHVTAQPLYLGGRSQATTVGRPARPSVAVNFDSDNNILTVTCNNSRAAIGT